jgi:hypothetical protein
VRHGTNRRSISETKCEFETARISVAVRRKGGGLGADAYEILAFMAESSTLALGQVAAGGRWQDIPLSQLGSSPQMTGGLLRPNHSYQYKYGIQTTWAFWSQIMVSSHVSSTYDV